MKKIALIVLTLIVFLGCDRKNPVPKGYYRATITGHECTPVVQVKGNESTKELDKYEYIYIKNLPDSLNFIGTEFYFKNYDESEAPICLAIYRGPHFTINTYNISFKTPK